MRVPPLFMHRSLSPSSMNTEMRACIKPMTEVKLSDSSSSCWLYMTLRIRSYIRDCEDVPDKNRLTSISQHKILAQRICFYYWVRWWVMSNEDRYSIQSFIPAVRGSRSVALSFPFLLEGRRVASAVVIVTRRFSTIR